MGGVSEERGGLEAGNPPVREHWFMTIADRLKMFEQAAASNTTASRPTTAAKSWGAARGPSIAEQIKKVRVPLCSVALLWILLK